MSRSYPLPRGPRVRLRIARPSDRAGVIDLLARERIELEELERYRLFSFDPRRRLVICATALIGATETVVGVGAIELGPDARTEPDLLVIDETLTDGLGELLAAALTGRASAIASRSAA
jgi:hypothetical protein